MKRFSPSSISDVIASALQQLGLKQKLKRYEVLDLWPSIVGERIAEVTSADRFEGGTLFVKVAHAPWRNELTFLKQELIAKINSTMHEEVVKEIIFR